MSDWFFNTEDRDADLNAMAKDYMGNKGLMSGTLDNTIQFDLAGNVETTADEKGDGPLGDIAR